MNTEPLQPLEAEVETVSASDFRFDGGAATYWGTGLLAAIITVFTFGLGYPFALVLLERWKAKHTYIEGRKLKFNASAWGLIGRWILWVVLTIITLGIYSFWVQPRIMRWKIEHLEFDTTSTADNPAPAEGRSDVPAFRFDGGAATYWGTGLLAFLVTTFTLGLAFPFALVLLLRWKAKHTYIEGRQVSFDGTGFGLFGNWLKWMFLTVITVGIYSFWIQPRLIKWSVEHQSLS